MSRAVRIEARKKTSAAQGPLHPTTQTAVGLRVRTHRFKPFGG